jgi:dihydroorotate dehydrogenase electron transfer subunit
LLLDKPRIERFTLKPFQVTENRRIAEGIYIIRLRPATNTSRDFFDALKPFMFFNIWVPRVDELPLSIAYVDNDSIYFLYRVRGEGTRTLSTKSSGSFVGLKGPLGVGYEPRAGERILAVVGGIGIAPIPLLIRKSMDVEAYVDVFWGVKSSKEFFDIVKVFSLPHSGWRLVKASEDCLEGVCGTVLDAVKDVNIDGYDTVIAVGPNEMLKAFCETFGSKKENVYVSLETVVKCGLGICGSCYIKGTNKLLCVDGSLFKCSEVMEHLKSLNS